MIFLACAPELCGTSFGVFRFLLSFSLRLQILFRLWGLIRCLVSNSSHLTTSLRSFLLSSRAGATSPSSPFYRRWNYLQPARFDNPFVSRIGSSFSIPYVPIYRKRFQELLSQYSLISKLLSAGLNGHLGFRKRQFSRISVFVSHVSFSTSLASRKGEYY